MEVEAKHPSILYNDNEYAISGRIFDEPLHAQHYELVIDELKKCQGVIRQVAHFGCGNCEFLRLARNALSSHVQSFVGVDTDRDLLVKSAPYLKQRSDVVTDETSLETLLFNGCIGDFDFRLNSVDAVVAFDQISCWPPELAQIRRSIFENMHPYIAIITVPDPDFNALFESNDRRFDHAGGGPAWSCREFRNWCSSIVARYSRYEVVYGRLPMDNTGRYSQMATFRLNAKSWYFKQKREQRQCGCGPRRFELVAGILDRSYRKTSGKREVLGLCKQYCDMRLNKMLGLGSNGVVISAKDIMDSLPMVAELCDNDPDALMRILICREDYGYCTWLMEFDVQEPRIYCHAGSCDEIEEEKPEDDVLQFEFPEAHVISPDGGVQS